MNARSPATIDDLRRVPKDGRVYELVDGAIVVTPAGARHANVSARITVLIANFVHPRSLGDVYTEGVGIILPNRNVRSPDVTFVRAEKLPGGRSPIDFPEVVPDLVVEVLSPSDRPGVVSRKVEEYIRLGVGLVWVVDPEARTVVAHRSTDDVNMHTDRDTLSGEPALQGFSCRVSDFFPPR